MSPILEILAVSLAVANETYCPEHLGELVESRIFRLGILPSFHLL